MFKCDCGREFNSYRALNGHQITHKQGPRYAVSRVSRSKPDRLKKCVGCDKMTANPKFCSNRCQRDWEWPNIYKPKIERGEGGNYTKYLTERDGYKCSCCGISSWNGKELVLQIDHIDGISDNNDPKNLRLICPNCHTQTETFAARNRKNTKRNEYLREYKRTRRYG